MPQPPDPHCMFCAGTGALTNPELTRLGGPARKPGDPVACLCVVTSEDTPQGLSAAMTAALAKHPKLAKLQHRGYHGLFVMDAIPYVRLLDGDGTVIEPAGSDPDAAFRKLVDDYIAGRAKMAIHNPDPNEIFLELVKAQLSMNSWLWQAHKAGMVIDVAVDTDLTDYTPLRSLRMLIVEPDKP